MRLDVVCVFLIVLTTSQAVVVKLRRSASTADLVAHVQYARETEMEAIEQLQRSNNSEVLSMLELGSSAQSISTTKIGFKYLEYLGDVTVNDKTFVMLFDTATSHTWLPSAGCSTCCPVDNPAPAIQSQGSTPMFEQFPDGTWFSGVSQSASFKIGTLQVPKFSYYQILVKGQKGVPKEATDCFDSVLGLSFSSRMAELPGEDNHQHLTQRELDAMETVEGIRLSFIDRLFHEHLTTEPVFTMYLTTEKDGSRLEIGAVDKTYVKSDLNPHGFFYVSAIGSPDFHWAFNVPRVCFDDNCFRVGNIPARVSSSVPYIALPQELYQLFRKPQERVPNPCQILKSLPTISLVTVGSNADSPSNRFARPLELCPADYVLVDEHGSCDFAIVPSKLPVIVLGTPFLRKFFSVFDIEQKRMGFAQSTNFCHPPEPPRFTMEQIQKALGEAHGDMAAAMKTLNEMAQIKDKKEPPFLKDNVFMTFQKKFVN